MDINAWLKAHPRPCKFGAPLGAANWSGDPSEPYKFYLQRLKMTDGCYTLDGTYWGGPADLYCAWAEHEEDGTIRVFVRANNHVEAKKHVLEEYVEARFFR